MVEQVLFSGKHYKAELSLNVHRTHESSADWSRTSWRQPQIPLELCDGAFSTFMVIVPAELVRSAPPSERQ